METALVSGVALLGKGLLSGAISDLYKTLKDSKNNSKISRILEELDIQNDIEIIEALLKDIEHKNKQSESTNICIKQIHLLIKNIKIEIENINLKIVEQHYAKYYLYNWSPCSYEEHIENLKKFKSCLDKRLERLFNILSINL